MGSVNRVILIGNLGKDAELRYTPGGAAVASFSLATTETWTDKSGLRQEKTEWHRVVLWGKQAESLQEYLVKGKQVYVEGKLQTRRYEKDGEKRYSTEVKAERITLLGGGASRRQHEADDDYSGSEGLTPEQARREAESQGAADPITDSDIPF